MTGTGQRVSNIRDISEVNYTLGLNHVASAGLSCFGALDNLWSWDFPRGRGVNTISNGGLHERSGKPLVLVRAWRARHDEIGHPNGVSTRGSRVHVSVHCGFPSCWQSS